MTNYPEVALIEAFKDGMLPSLKQMIMVTRDTLPATLKECRIWQYAWIQNRRTNDYEISMKQGKGRYLYLDSIFQEQNAPKGWRGQMPRTVRAGDLEIEGRTIGAGFVKLSEEELEKRRKEGACFKCNKKGHYSRECRSVRGSRPGQLPKDTGNREPNMVQVRGIEDRLFPAEQRTRTTFQSFHGVLMPEERSDIRHLYNAGQDFESPFLPAVTIGKRRSFDSPDLYHIWFSVPVSLWLIVLVENPLTLRHSRL